MPWPCTLRCVRHSLAVDRLDKMASVLGDRLAASKLVGHRQVGRMVLVQHTLACCRFVSGSSCHIESGVPTMELGISGRLVHGKLVASMLVLGTRKLALACSSLELACGRTALACNSADGKIAHRSHRCKLVHMGLMQPRHIRREPQWQQRLPVHN